MTSVFRRHAPGWAVASLVVTAAGVAAAIVLLVANPDAPPDGRGQLLALALTILPYGVAGSLLISRRPDLPFGWLLCAGAAAGTVGLFTTAPALFAAARGESGWLVQLGLGMAGLMVVPLAVQGLINVRFPSGRPASRKGRLLELVLAGSLLVVVLGAFLGGTTVSDALSEGAPGEVQPSLAGRSVPRVIADFAASLVPLVVLLGLVAGIGVVVRYWRAVGIERQQLKWRAVGVCVAIALFPLAVTERLGAVANYLEGTVFVATLAVPVLRYRLWAIDTIIRRSMVYAAVSAVLVAAYAVIIAIGVGLVPERVAASIAAAGIALAFAPVRAWSQRMVDSLFYGQRSKPYQALSEVAARLDTVAAAGDVLPAVVDAVAGTLRLPYVAIEGPGDAGVLAAAGDATLATSPGARRWELTFQGALVGSLMASPRRGEGTFDDRDSRILADIARQAGPAVRAEALTADLLDSRARLVTTREEERRRLRRDLHDGLGPMLTGLGLNLDAARSHLASAASAADQPARAAELARVDEFLERGKAVSTQAITDLRGLVNDLRPPALDDLGLVGAVELYAGRLGSGTDTELRIDAAALPDLPAAVEVAAFRTAIEAMTNTVRHGHARLCTVRLRAPGDGWLVLEVADDGRATKPWRPGVGLTAMRERAAELGGTLTAGPTPAGGLVVARYPLPSSPTSRASAPTATSGGQP